MYSKSTIRLLLTCADISIHSPYPVLWTWTHARSTQNVHAKSLNEKNLRNLFKLASCKYIIFKPYIPQYCTILCCTHSVGWMKKKERARVWLLLKQNSFVCINQIWAKQINNKKMASENFAPWIHFFPSSSPFDYIWDWYECIVLYILYTCIYFRFLFEFQF